MGKNVVACDKCLAKEELTTYKVEERGYPSVFHGDTFHIALCPSCCENLQVKAEWFEVETCYEEYFEQDGTWFAQYLYEENIQELISELTQEAQFRIDTCDNIFGLNQLHWG